MNAKLNWLHFHNILAIALTGVISLTGLGGEPLRAQSAPPAASGEETVAHATTDEPGPAWEIDPAALERVSRDVEYLASEELEGRGPDTVGIELAGQYLIERYQELGLQPMPDGSYAQHFSIPMGRSFDESTCRLILRGPDTELEWELDADFAPQVGRRSIEASGGLAFVGYGIRSEEFNYDEYRDLDVSDKFVILIRMAPQQEDEESVFQGEEVSPYAYISTKVETAMAAGAAGVLMVNDRVTAPTEDADRADLSRNRARFNQGNQDFPFVHVTRQAVNRLLEAAPIQLPDGEPVSDLERIEQYIDRTLEPLSTEFADWQIEYTAEVNDLTADIYNVVGILEGEGALRDEYIVIGAHFDHLGYGGYGSRTPGRIEIHYGADDNASGTAAVLELARRFAERENRPRRSIVFACFNGEERGLHGSRFYVNNPPWPLDQTVAMLNFDMIGHLRNDQLQLIHGASADEFQPLFEQFASHWGLELDVGDSPQPNSDHFPFYQNEIPNIFFHTGLTPTYHTPEDVFEILDMEGALRVIGFAEQVLKGIDQLEEPPQFNSLSPARARIQSSFGAQVDFDAPDGPTIIRITEGSAAEQSGLLQGDILLFFDSTRVTNRQTIFNLLRDNAPGTKVEVQLIRDGEEETIELTLGER